MKTIVILFIAVGLQGCAGLQSYIPSFWDDNQSARIVDIQLAADQLNCAQAQAPQVAKIQSDLRWFELYSLSKGARQTDVLKLTRPMQDTVGDWSKRLQTNPDNPVYCQLKKRVLVEQTTRAAKAVLGRF
jgi:hypothetical protein